MSERTKSGPAPKCRLHVILARRAPRAVIFRRGPSTHVGLFLWHLDTDEVEEGQWLRGRIYERRADLSPSGEHLVYFAAKWSTPMATWTAVSRPPWLTALGLWPKGDAWGGGGHFDANDALAINHAPSPITLAPGDALPPRLKIRELGLGCGEDRPIWGARLRRDGWTCTHTPRYAHPDFTRDVAWEYDPPEEWTRASPTDPHRVLSMRIHGIHEKSGDWYVVDHVVREKPQSRRAREKVLELGRTEWADWAPSGDLLFAKAGVLHRLARKHGLSEESARVVVDLRDRRFVARASPARAGRW